ncbi:hypothetical protein I79_014986 [Cricetulus griseus]|uniref:Uncharacterized protein n=1 Tax=Cricetulus griseus TaxID=10029 RepID=G3HVJ7_CRIGR|nr:hypothetical protein I79_014986 [Cricetulus griseus]
MRKDTYFKPLKCVHKACSFHSKCLDQGNKARVQSKTWFQKLRQSDNENIS